MSTFMTELLWHALYIIVAVSCGAFGHKWLGKEVQAGEDALNNKIAGKK